MKFTLIDYQDDAFGKVLENLEKAQRRWKSEGERSAFSLAAATGAGKTVIAAAVFEALFHGDEDFDFEPDPNAVVLWFSDDPSLNEQTRFRIIQSADRLAFDDLVVVQNTFNRERFEGGKIYFLNTQKLSRNSLLVRGHDPEIESMTAFPEMRPDLRSYTIWDTIRNTIEDPELTLHLVLDEAHRGMKSGTAAGAEDRSTVVRKLINGVGSVPAVPIVWGISATIERFNAAMTDAADRSILPNIIVDVARVRKSGLLKDTVILDVPRAIGALDIVLVRRAVDKLRESTNAWAEYASQQGDASVVEPLLILQLPNLPNHDEVGRALDAMFLRWPELSIDAVAHVLGEHSTQTFGRYKVPYISPERVQDSSWIRILVAKDAISTGWDCPRAEVLVSFRASRERTHITQLLGRMIRAPLARRIPGNERLNSVECLLPFFDPESVKAVVDELNSGGGENGEPRTRVLVNPREMRRNARLPDSVWDKFNSLPSESAPQRTAKPVKRLTSLAHELAVDDLLPDAGKKVHADLHQILDAARVRYDKEITEARGGVVAVAGRSVRIDVATANKTFDDFVESADITAIDGAYRRACRVLNPDICRTYAEYLAMEGGMSEEALVEAHIVIASLGLVPETKVFLDTESEKIATSLLNAFRKEIKSLSDERQETYRQIRGMSPQPEDIDLAVPTLWLEPTVAREADGREMTLPLVSDHLMCGEDFLFPVNFDSSWEHSVLDVEMARPGFMAWYRNPPRPSQDSLGISYVVGTELRTLRPDFIFFSEDQSGAIVADIVDPHGTQLSDALPKIRGLARYAETHEGIFRRIEAVAKIGPNLKTLDLTKAEVRKAVQIAEDALSLYNGDVANFLRP